MTILEVCLRSLPHLAIGAAVFYAIVGSEKDTAQRKASLFLIGAAVGLSPDFTKVFGDIAFHSLLSVPFAAVFYAVLIRLFLLDGSLLRLTAATAATIVFAHLFIDAAGNGCALLFPLTDREFSLGFPPFAELLLSLLVAAGLAAALTASKARSIAAALSAGVFLTLIAAGTIDGVSIRFMRLIIYEVKNRIL